MSYEERMAELGIDRGRLGKVNGFEIDGSMTTVKQNRQPNRFHDEIGERVPIDPAPEDLSHLNPAGSAENQRKVRARWAQLSAVEKSERNRKNRLAGEISKPGKGRRGPKDGFTNRREAA